MGRKVESPVKRWPGYVVLFDPIPLVKVAEFEKAIGDAKESGGTEYQAKLLPALLACVEKWNLNSGFPKNVTVETFPGTPRTDSAKLIAALVNEIVEIYKGDADSDPN